MTCCSSRSERWTTKPVQKPRNSSGGRRLERGGQESCRMGLRAANNVVVRVPLVSGLCPCKGAPVRELQIGLAPAPTAWIEGGFSSPQSTIGLGRRVNMRAHHGRAAFARELRALLSHQDYRAASDFLCLRAGSRQKMHVNVLPAAAPAADPSTGHSLRRRLIQKRRSAGFVALP